MVLSNAPLPTRRDAELRARIEAALRTFDVRSHGHHDSHHAAVALALVD